jgi:pre-rRNA-processing protein TSR3
MQSFPNTFIWRHRKENLKKCSLRGLEIRADLTFLTYPTDPLPILNGYVILSMDGEPLSEADRDRGLLLIDGTWRYAEKMERAIKQPFETRSLPTGYRTAYPRRQDDCADPERGLASVEALYLAYLLMGRDPAGILDHYHWRETFLAQFSV